jgi:hypothetical protein
VLFSKKGLNPVERIMSLFERVQNTSFEKIITILIITFGFILSTIQFLHNRSLWLDESYLALNIIERSPLELLKPLDFIQIAPILFLQIEKIFTCLIPDSEYGLRLFPLIAFWLSIFLFHKILNIIQKNSLISILSLSLLVFNPTLIYYSSEVKQYMIDVLVLTFMYYLLLRDYKTEVRKYCYIAFFGIIAIFLSNISPVILSAAGLYLLYGYFIADRENSKYVFFTLLLWLFTFVLYYFLFIHNHPSRPAQIKEWTIYKGFLPANILSSEFYMFLIHEGKTVVTSLFQFGKIGAIIISILMLSGIWVLFRKKRIDIIILTLVPIFIHLFLSALKYYPFDKRLIIYTCPIVIIICSFGFNYFIDLVHLKMTGSNILAAIIPLLIILPIILNGLPIKTVEIKNSLTFITQHLKGGDKIFVNYYATFPYRYYKKIHFTNIDSNAVVYGDLNKVIFRNDRYLVDTLGYYKELNVLTGRVWFLSTSIADEGEKQVYLKKYFDLKGIKSSDEFHSERSDAYLYDIRN